MNTRDLAPYLSLPQSVDKSWISCPNLALTSCQKPHLDNLALGLTASNSNGGQTAMTQSLLPHKLLASTNLGLCLQTQLESIPPPGSEAVLWVGGLFCLMSHFTSTPLPGKPFSLPKMTQGPFQYGTCAPGTPPNTYLCSQDPPIQTCASGPPVQTCAPRVPNTDLCSHEPQYRLVLLGPPNTDLCSQGPQYRPVLLGPQEEWEYDDFLSHHNPTQLIWVDSPSALA